MNLHDYLAAAQAEVIDFPIDVGGSTITIKLRRLDRTDVERANRNATSVQFDAKTRQRVEKLDEKKLQSFLVSHCLAGWEGVTYGIAARLAGKVAPNGELKDFAGKQLEFSEENATALLRSVIGLEGQIWSEVLRRADERDEEIAAEKND